jgi:predicted Rossmann fold flavoprotein
LSKIAIIGAGAAGCFAAANIPPGHEIVVFEKGGKPMQKVKVSGGGRCNVTHACFDIAELIKRYPRGQSLLKRSLHQFGPRQTIEWFRSRGVTIKEEADGRMFPVTDDSQTIIDCIWSAMMKGGVQVRFNRAVRNVLRADNGWALHFDDGSSYICDSLLLSPGSLQKPEQWAWIGALGHTIQPPAPSLFTFNLPGNAITQLMGVAVPEVGVKLAGTKFSQRGPLLITHWGFSGPAVLRTSAWAARA